MRFVLTKDLKAGMIPVRNIYNDRNELLLAANNVLDDTMIKRLRSINYYGLLIYDEYSGLEEYDEVISESTRRDAIIGLKALSIDKVIYCTNKIVDDLMQNDSVLLDMNSLFFYDSDTYKHSANVCMLSTACGIVMGLKNTTLRKLALGAMLHDIGKMSISKDILNKPGKLNEQERAIIETHPQRGYDMVYDNPDISTSSRACILCHHENWDGTGYPKGLYGYNIPLLARIVHVADVYEAMCRKRVYKNGFEPASVIEYLYGNCGSMFDIDVVEKFVRSIVIYPVGTEVMLSTGDMAVVIKNRTDYATRPVVCRKKDKKVLDLAKDRRTYNITIKGSDKISELSENRVAI